jgi:hypothetical protein
MTTEEFQREIDRINAEIRSAKRKGKLLRTINRIFPPIAAFSIGAGCMLYSLVNGLI